MPAGQSPDAAPLLSIVVATHRVERYLRTCLDSILADADDRVEVIGVDDASPDRGGEILDYYAHHDPRMRVLHLVTNVGLGQARNAGLEAATGSYVWFVDGDDDLAPGAVPAVLDRLASRQPDVLLVDHVEIFDDGRVEHPWPRGVPPLADGPVDLGREPHLLRLAQSACTKIARRAFLDEIKLRFSPGWYEDTSYSHRLLIAAGRVEVLNRVCYHYRQRTVETITSTVSHRHFEVFDQYARLFNWLDTDPPAAHTLRRELFRVMIDHYLVIIGNDHRVPPERRREFFARMAADFRARVPHDGYDAPRGVRGFKHRLVRHQAYRTYATLRRVYRLARRIGTRLHAAVGRRPGWCGRRLRSPEAAAPRQARRHDRELAR